MDDRKVPNQSLVSGFMRAARDLAAWHATQLPPPGEQQPTQPGEDLTAEQSEIAVYLGNLAKRMATEQFIASNREQTRQPRATNLD